MTIAPGFHLFPFRTEKLSPVTPMVLRNSGRVGSRRFFSRAPAVTRDCGGFFYGFLPAVPSFPGMLPGVFPFFAPRPSAGILLPAPFILRLALPFSCLVPYGLCFPATVYGSAGVFSMRGNISPQADCYPLSKWITCGLTSE